MLRENSSSLANTNNNRQAAIISIPIILPAGQEILTTGNNLRGSRGTSFGEPGFMSNFLYGEKEKMSRAKTPLFISSSAPLTITSLSTQQQGLPISTMLPDSMLGPAYNSAVSHALPLESGTVTEFQFDNYNKTNTKC